MPPITYRRATSDDQLHQILEIQKRALKHNMSAEQRESDGFITIPHTFEILKNMNDACPHCLAVCEDQVVGYALVMLESLRTEMEILVPMFQAADRLLPQRNYVAMGQVCIDGPFRGRGVFRGLYNFYRAELSGQYDCLFTEIASSNTRSMNAHQAVGFTVLDAQVTDGTRWEMVCWFWNDED